MTASLRHRLRTLALWAMLSPFLMLSLLSPAVMPAQAADGTFTLVLCTGDGPVEMQLDLATGQPVHKSPSDRSDRCAWACARMAIAPDAPPVLPVLLGRVTRADPPPVSTRLALSRATGLPPSTGPPAVA